MFSELFLEMKAVLTFCLFNHTIQKYGGPVIVISYLCLQVYLYKAFESVLAPCFTLAWAHSKPGFTSWFIHTGYVLSFLAFALYVLVIILGPGYQSIINTFGTGNNRWRLFRVAGIKIPNSPDQNIIEKNITESIILI